MASIHLDSAWYEAGKFGVFTPMPTARARKLCPKLIVLSGDFERYEQFSNWMFGCETSQGRTSACPAGCRLSRLLMKAIEAWNNEATLIGGKQRQN